VTLNAASKVNSASNPSADLHPFSPFQKLKIKELWGSMIGFLKNPVKIFVHRAKTEKAAIGMRLFGENLI